MAVSTPLSLPAWERALTSHPDRAFARYICQGYRYGFMIEFQRSAQLRPAKANMEPANQRSEVVSEYLHNECSLGRNAWALPRDLTAAATTHQPIQSYSRGRVCTRHRV